MRKSEVNAAESVACLNKALIRLKEIWEEIGIPEDLRLQRTNVVHQHIKDMLDMMIQEEEGMKMQLQTSLETCREQLAALCEELQMPLFPEAEGATMLQLEKDRRTQLDMMLAHKKQRTDELRALLDREQELCDILCSVPFGIDRDRVPSLAQLECFRGHVANLTAEKERQHGEFVSLKAQIGAALGELERLPETRFERDVMCEDEEAFCLSKDNIGLLKLLLSELEECKAKNDRQCSAYRSTIRELWDRLQVPQEEREAMSAHMVRSRKSNAKALRAEMERLEAQKLKRIRGLVEAFRAEVALLWDKCFYGAEQRRDFVPYYDEDTFTEELLKRHEAEVATLKRRYEAHRELFDGVGHWQENWLLFLELDRKANDPSRLNNRGGNLLKDQKQRADLQKSLPKLEKSLKARIDLWEQDCGGQFLVEGQHFLEYVQRQWAAFHEEKEKEKMDRQMKKTKQLQVEVRFGARTPSKGPLPSGATPCKVRKLSSASTLGNSTTLSVGFTGAICHSSGPRLPPSARKVPGARMPANGKASRSLERNKENAALTPHHDKNSLNVKPPYNPDGTFSSVTGTYSDFARDLSEATKSNLELNSTVSHHWK